MGVWLHVALPIIQAPMAGVQGSALAAAVCEAGGLGSLPCALLTLEDMRRELSSLAARTSGPYNVNFFCHTMPAIDEARESAWRHLLAPYYDELGVTQTPAPPAARLPFNAEAAQLLQTLRPAFVSFHFGLPEPALLALVKASGATVLSSATTVDEAKWLEKNGADAIIAQGVDAGGHRGHFLAGAETMQRTTLELLPEVVRAVSVPVIAAGGIADAAGVREVLALGAIAAQIGTAYLLCPEATTSPVHRAELSGPGAADTVITNLFTGRPARGIVNRLIRDLGAVRDDVPAFPRAAAALAPLRAEAEAAGRGDFSGMWAGRNAARCRAMPAAELTRQLAG